VAIQSRVPSGARTFLQAVPSTSSNNLPAASCGYSRSHSFESPANMAYGLAWRSGHGGEWQPSAHHMGGPMKGALSSAFSPLGRKTRGAAPPLICGCHGWRVRMGRAATPPLPRRSSPLRTSVSRRLRLSRAPSETPLRGALAGSGAPAARSTGVQTTRSERDRAPRRLSAPPEASSRLRKYAHSG
jgi:hypothetical protein